MTDLEAIRIRKSRRRFTGPLDEADAAVLVPQMEALNASHGLCMHLERDNPEGFGGFTKTYGTFSGVRSFFVLAGSEDDPHLFEKAGHAGERLLLEATKLGLGSCWVGGTFNRSGLQKKLAERQQLVAVIVLGPADEKPSLKERVLRGGVHLKSKTLEEMYTANTPPPPWFIQGVKAALLAPSGVNAQPVHFRFSSFTATAHVPDAMPHQHTDLGIAKLHFEIAAEGCFDRGNGAAFHLLQNA